MLPFMPYSPKNARLDSLHFLNFHFKLRILFWFPESRSRPLTPFPLPRLRAVWSRTITSNGRGVSLYSDTTRPGVFVSCRIGSDRIGSVCVLSEEIDLWYQGCLSKCSNLSFVEPDYLRLFGRYKYANRSSVCPFYPHFFVLILHKLSLNDR